MANHIVVFYSGGLSSFLAAHLTLQQVDATRVTLLFTDTKMEDEDLYRFLDESSEALGLLVTRIADGRTPWEVFRDVRYLGNTRVDPCSDILKRKLARKWVEQHYQPNEVQLQIGLSLNETHRLGAVINKWQPFNVVAPLIDAEILEPGPMALAALKRYGIKPPRLYGMGFTHNNCGGFCIKAGHGQFANLLAKMPERYREHELAEEDIRSYLDKDVSILRDRKGGVTKPLTLQRFRQSIENKSRKVDKYDIGGCGCFL